MSQCLKGFQGNLNTTIIKNSPDWFHNSELRAVSNFNSSKSALAEHVCETSHNIAWEDSKVITTNNRYGQRLCLEAWHINASPCALNRDDGSHLPQEYLHLILLVNDVTLTAYKDEFQHQTTPNEDTRPECRNVGS